MLSIYTIHGPIQSHKVPLRNLFKLWNFSEFLFFKRKMRSFISTVAAYLHRLVLGCAVDGKLCHMQQVEEEQERSHQLAGCLAGGAGAQPQPPPSPALSQQPTQHQAWGGGGQGFLLPDSRQGGAGTSDYLFPVFRIRFHRIHMFLGLPDPDPLVRGMDPAPDSDHSIILLSSRKIVTKTMISTVLWLVYDLFLKNDLYVLYLQKVICNKICLLTSWSSLPKIGGSGSGSVSHRV